MKIRLTLALLVVLGIGTSVYFTHNAQLINTPTAALCCDGIPR
ncbi:MAG: hypothetical protein ACE14M_14890 [Terriglobales bacterium]